MIFKVASEFFLAQPSARFVGTDFPALFELRTESISLRGTFCRNSYKSLRFSRDKLYTCKSVTSFNIHKFYQKSRLSDYQIFRISGWLSFQSDLIICYTQFHEVQKSVSCPYSTDFFSNYCGDWIFLLVEKQFTAGVN